MWRCACVCCACGVYCVCRSAGRPANRRVGGGPQRLAKSRGLSGSRGGPGRVPERSREGRRVPRGVPRLPGALREGLGAGGVPEGPGGPQARP